MRATSGFMMDQKIECASATTPMQASVKATRKRRPTGQRRSGGCKGVGRKRRSFLRSKRAVKKREAGGDMIDTTRA